MSGVMTGAGHAAVVGHGRLAPVLFTVWMSLHKWPLLGVPSFNWGSNYTRMLVDTRFFSALGFTAYYTIIVTIAIFVVAFPLAVFVEKQRPLI